LLLLLLWMWLVVLLLLLLLLLQLYVRNIDPVIGMNHHSFQQFFVLGQKGRPLGPGGLGYVLQGQVPPDVADPPQDG